MHGTVPDRHQEIEIKLELGPANLPHLKKIPFLRTVKPTPRGAPQVSVYFDTNSQKLRKKGLMLRVRREGRHYTQTIKATTNGEQFERDEWEAEIAGNKPDLDRANGTALEPLLTRKLRRRLKPVFETRVRRTVYPLVDNAHAIALTVDQGAIDTGTRSQPLCEIELELKRGAPPICSTLRANSRKRCRRDLRSRANPNAATRFSMASKNCWSKPLPSTCTPA